MCSDVQWRLCWENELQQAEHVELSEFFLKTYGPTGAFNAKPFEGGRSWAGARPELRAISYDAHGVAAHIGILRRFIKVDEVELLVADLGLYGVRPDLEGQGISHSMRVVYPVLRQLGVPFAFGTVRHAMRNHFERFCRDGLAAIVSGVRVRSTLADVYLDLPPTCVEDVLVVVVPIERSMSEWPSGTLIVRNGPEL
ncbi:NodA family N-acyltransferase [Mesorhizobium loti]|uniref:Nodulation protein A n=1 Tax=Rhizobium loti TaxID=381 RepID=M5B2H9_RHILI|nr:MULTISPECIES: NodA family N-acyltransferase [Mesorhizobium]ANN61856.1 acyltransferase [Mesorhizobium loti NZP2037]OBP80095.1 acyltransferase [Mesorhizobium loti]OBP85610.1 acyltransferase [Mesorhizobium loti]OBP96990.1 acyltransferase [Mesorhizobium loti]OBQ59157.1 acyltransferase [Mesorhizobium loti]